MNNSFLKNRHVIPTIYVGLIVGTVLAALKLIGILNWHWLAVTAPFWSIISHLFLVLVISIMFKKQDCELKSALVGLVSIINLFVIFAALRFLQIINWSWLIISIPLWIGLGLMLLTVFGFAMKKRHSDKK